MSTSILTLNAGSSSVKFALYSMGDGATPVARGAIDRIGLDAGGFVVKAGDRTLVDRREPFADHDAALGALFETLRSGSMSPDAIGHRIVQGGPRWTRPARLTPAIVDELRRWIPLAPNHLPAEIAAVEAAWRAYPEAPQIGCFDTAFHRGMPEIAQRLPLPRRYFDLGIIRYGFHGLSYEYIVEELRRRNVLNVGGRLVVAHLGNGASMAAVKDGRPIDTTMGLTPLGGLMMSTRAGDLDPGVVLELIRNQGLAAPQAEDLLAKRSGLLGVSETSSDMKDLLERQSSDVRAAEAVEMFCRQARKFVASLAASLEGIDTLVFTGGIGEHASEVRARIAGGLAFLGVDIDLERNSRGDDVVSSESSAVAVRVMKTNEEWMIARHTMALIRTDF